jgi:hypothetical protein
MFQGTLPQAADQDAACQGLAVARQVRADPGARTQRRPGAYPAKSYKYLYLQTFVITNFCNYKLL